MTPSRSRSDRGTFAFDKQIRGVGRFRVASGTNDPKVFKKLSGMLDALLDQGRLDLVGAMKDRQLSMMQVYNAFRLGDLDRLPSVDQLIPLVGALETFAKTYECGERHRESLWTFHSYVKKHAPADAKVPDLPITLRYLRAVLVDKPRQFNQLRSAAQSFMRSRYGKGSKLWLAVAQVEPLKVVPKVIKHPATVAEMLDLCQKLPTTMRRQNAEVQVDMAGMCWTLATSGMRTVVEYFDGEWAKKSGFLEIGTGKKDKAVRRVPLIREPVEAQCDVQALRDAMEKATDGQMTPYDLRRTYANWLEAAEIPRTRRLLYLGHGNIDITGRYEWHDVKAFLAEDAEKVTAWLDAEIAKAEAAAKPKLRAIK
jgi:integrase